MDVRAPNDIEIGEVLLRIDRISLENYRCFQSLVIDFEPDLTVIVARNGFGKTAVLDAISVALGLFVGAFDVVKGVGFKASDVRCIPNPKKAFGESEPQYPLSQHVEGVVDSRFQKWSRALNSPDSYTTYGKASVLNRYGKRLQKAVRDAALGRSHPNLPVISYYGTGRLWGEKRLRFSKKHPSKTSRTLGYVDCLDSASHYKIFADWFERLCRSEWEERENPKVLSEIRNLLSTVRDAVDCVLRPSGWHGITFKSAKAGVVVTHDQYGELSVDWLSDGIRNMIAMAADIAHRAVRLNSHLGADAVRESTGIVLIDEVDMHLHPEWQQTVLASLREAFPRIQFIVTTHSPQVLTSVRAKCIRKLKIDDEGRGIVEIPSFNTYAEESLVTLEDVMETSSRPPIDIVAKLKRYQNMVELGHYKSEEALQLRRDLEKVYGPNHIEFQMPDMDIRRFEALSKKAESR